jgi:hypothetical protein
LLLSSDVWVAALIRRAELGGAYATVARRGDARAGAVIVKVFDSSTRQARLYSEAVGPDGERIWMQPIQSEVEASLDEYLERQARYDPDVWVVEIEDRGGRHFITEKVAPTG